MLAKTEDMTTAQQRIAAAFDPAAYRDAGELVVDALANYLARAESASGVVLNWRAPPENIAAARAALQAGASPPRCTDDAAAVAQRIGELLVLILTRGQTLHDPRYIGHQVPPPLPLAALFDAVSATTNQAMAVYEMGPFATAVETVMIETLGEALGLPTGSFGGALTSGGSLANLTALLTARNVALGDAWEAGLASCDRPPVIIGHAESHYSSVRAAGVIGIGTRQFLHAAVDDQARLDPQRLDAQLKQLRDAGTPIIAVVASACSTRTGVFDPLADIADVCARHGVWLHVDAAHGGAACLSDKHRHRLAGIERADSAVWDAHKMLYMPALCAYIFYKDKSHRFRTFHQDAPYLFDPAAADMAEFDSGLVTVECTKRAAAYGLWAMWSLFGRQLFADMADLTFDLAQRFHGMLAAAADFEPLHEPQSNIIVFRHAPDASRDWPAQRLGEFQWRLRRRVIESGEFYIVPGKAGGVGALRAVIMNPMTTAEHLEALLECLRRHGREMLAEA